MKYIAVLSLDIADFEIFMSNLDSNFTVNRQLKETIGNNGIKFIMVNEESRLMTCEVIGMLITPNFFMLKNANYIKTYAFTRIRI